jgi:hypothetical protein
MGDFLPKGQGMRIPLAFFLASTPNFAHARFAGAGGGADSTESELSPGGVDVNSEFKTEISQFTNSLEDFPEPRITAVTRTAGKGGEGGIGGKSVQLVEDEHAGEALYDHFVSTLSLVGGDRLQKLGVVLDESDAEKKNLDSASGAESSSGGAFAAADYDRDLQEEDNDSNSAKLNQFSLGWQKLRTPNVEFSFPAKKRARKKRWSIFTRKDNIIACDAKKSKDLKAETEEMKQKQKGQKKKQKKRKKLEKKELKECKKRRKEQLERRRKQELARKEMEAEIGKLSPQEKTRRAIEAAEMGEEIFVDDCGEEDEEGESKGKSIIMILGDREKGILILGDLKSTCFHGIELN